MAGNKQKTIFEKWGSDSKEKGHGLHFHDAPDTGKRIPMEGFTDEELRRIIGEDEVKKYNQNVDEIDEI